LRPPVMRLFFQNLEQLGLRDAVTLAGFISTSRLMQR
jgi:hypothetical protein